MIAPLLRKVRGNLTVLAHTSGQRRVPYLPAERLEALRDRRLRRLVRYAAATVPYYRDLFHSLGADPRDLRGAGDLKSLPLLDREIVRRDPGRFRSSSRRAQGAVPFVTSGTTGEPLTIYHDLHSLLANIAYSERERVVVAQACGRLTGYREASLIYAGATVDKVKALYHRHTFIPIRPERLSLSVEQSLESIVEALRQFRPQVLIGYGSYLETFFRVAAHRGLEFPPPKVVVYGADTMSEPGRRFIVEQLGIPVLSRYAAIESFKIAFTCEAVDGFHLHDDLCPVRLIDGAGKTVPDGTPGEVVISNLVNHGTVLLNYRLGDLAVRATAGCRCGRTLPLLSELRGRVEEVLFLPDGRLVHPRSVWGVFKHLPEVLRYQLIQERPDHFELRLMTADVGTYERIVGDVLARLRELLGPVTIDAEFSPELDSRRAGKFQPVVSRCRPAP
jgi:phenylacetate-CoA ligase